jgi:aryl-alcohol dehydrogenase-like predicted oxidoreductase
LRRLKPDVIDLYQIHWPQLDSDIEESWTGMAIEGRRQSALHRCFELQRCTDETHAEDYADSFLAAALLASYG